MKASPRHVFTIVGVLGALASASPAMAQRQVTPQTGPRLMVPAFAGPKQRFQSVGRVSHRVHQDVNEPCGHLDA